MKIILTVLMLAFVGAVVLWPYNTRWGQYVIAGLGIALSIVGAVMLRLIFWPRPSVEDSNEGSPGSYKSSENGENNGRWKQVS